MLSLPMLGDLACYDGSYDAQVASKRATSELTGRFVGAAVRATRAAYGGGPLGRYSADLIVPAGVAAECALLKSIAYRYVMRRPGVDESLIRQRMILTELVAALAAAGMAALSPVMRMAWQRAESSAERLRVVIDQVAHLTDSAAIAWHAKLVYPSA
jgi:dGTPase